MDKTPWWMGGVFGTAWYASVLTVAGPPANDIAFLGLLVVACLPVWVFAEAPEGGPTPDRGKPLLLCLIGVLAAGVVAALAPGPEGRASVVLIIFLTTAATIVFIWLGWALMTGLALVAMGAAIEPGWLLRASGRWVPWVPAGLGLLTAYQLWAIPNAVPGDLAVDLPTNTFVRHGVARPLLRGSRRAEATIARPPDTVGLSFGWSSPARPVGSGQNGPLAPVLRVGNDALPS